MTSLLSEAIEHADDDLFRNVIHIKSTHHYTSSVILQLGTAPIEKSNHYYNVNYKLKTKFEEINLYIPSYLLK